MKTNVSNFTEFRKYYLSEFELYDGEAFITFNEAIQKFRHEYGLQRKHIRVIKLY